MGKVDKFKTFESETMKTMRYKDMYQWGKRYGVNDNSENETKATELIVKSMKSKGTPHLDWINNKGFSIDVRDGSTRNASGNLTVLDHLGMAGLPYTFYLVPSWNKSSFIEYLLDECRVEEDDISKLMGILNWDIDDLEIYGKPKNYFYSFNGGYQLEEVSEELLRGEEFKYTIDESSDIDIGDCPLWGALVPLRFNGGVPSEGSSDHNMLCEYGLIMIRNQINKLMLCTGSTKYDQLEQKMPSDRDIMSRDTNFLISYMNKSNVHISKNEDLEMAALTADHLYQASKLFHENHEKYNRRFSIPKSLVSDFLTLKV